MLISWIGRVILILNLVEPAQMNSEQRLEAVNVPWCWHESRWKAEFQIREAFESEDHWNISAAKLEGKHNLHEIIASSQNSENPSCVAVSVLTKGMRFNGRGEGKSDQSGKKENHRSGDCVDVRSSSG